MFAGNHAVEHVFASALRAQRHLIKGRRECQERRRRNPSRRIIKHEKAAKAVENDFGFAGFALDHGVMAHRLIARTGAPAAVSIERRRRRLSDHVVVDQRPAREGEIAIGKLLECRLARLALRKDRQHVVFTLNQARRGKPHPGKGTQCGRLCRRAILAGSSMEENKTTHLRAHPLRALCQRQRFPNTRQTSVPARTR